MGCCYEFVGCWLLIVDDLFFNSCGCDLDHIPKIERCTARASASFLINRLYRGKKKPTEHCRNPVPPPELQDTVKVAYLCRKKRHIYLQNTSNREKSSPLVCPWSGSDLFVVPINPNPQSNTPSKNCEDEDITHHTHSPV